ncbi:MAG: hypothetical protein RL169_1944, partial [Armatimonadota bacterium]
HLLWLAVNPSKRRLTSHIAIISNFDDARLFGVMDANIEHTGIRNFESLFDE